MFSLVVLFVTPWLVYCMPPPATAPPIPTTTPPPPTTPHPPTTTPLPTTIPAMCTCSEGTQIAPGESHVISVCSTCYCDKQFHVKEVMRECSILYCVDPVLTPDRCCPYCPNGDNCLAEFIDFNGTPRSEIISGYHSVVYVEAARCKCKYENYYGVPKASCEQVTTTPPPTTTGIY